MGAVLKGTTCKITSKEGCEYSAFELFAVLAAVVVIKHVFRSNNGAPISFENRAIFGESAHIHMGTFVHPTARPIVGPRSGIDRNKTFLQRYDILLLLSFQQGDSSVFRFSRTRGSIPSAGSEHPGEAQVTLTFVPTKPTNYYRCGS